MPQKFVGAPAVSNPMTSLQSMYRRPTVFLGLGGTGCHAVANLKLLYERTFKDFAEEGAIGVIPADFQFLGFDSDAMGCPAALVSGKEWIRLEANITRDTMKRIRDEEYYRDWIPNIDTFSFKTGAGGMRALGKLLFTRNMTVFAKHLGAKLSTAQSTHALDEGDPVIYIFAGLAGGTGSGAVLEACFYIRQNYPAARIIGLLGVVAGEIGKPQDIQTNAAVGCHAALREINTFQDPALREKLRGKYAADTVFSYPIGGHHGVYTQPFNYIFLVGDQSHRGVKNLTDARSLTAFIARTAFMLTAYPAITQQGHRNFESEMIDHLAAADDRLGGGLATYLVPGFGQLRLPGELTADYLTCTLGKNVVEVLRGGNGYDSGDGAKLATYLADQKLSVAELGPEIAYDNAGKRLVATEWMGELRPSMENAKYRYSNAGREELLSYGQDLGTTYLVQLKKEMANRAADVIAIRTARIYDEVVRCLKDPALRLVGANSFLISIRAHVGNQLTTWSENGSKEKEEGLVAIRNSWNAIKRLITDVCTDNGPMDRAKDRFNVGHAIAQYADFLNNNQGAVIQWAQAEMASEILGAIARFADNLEARLRLLSETLVAVETVFADEHAALAGKLLAADEGSVADVVSINGFNLLGKEWRESYLKSPQRQADQILANMCAGAWDPSRWLDALGEQDAKFKIAQDVYDRIWAYDTGKVTGITVAEVYKNETENAEDKLSELLDEKVSPQLPHHEMVSKYGMRPQLGFIGNVDEFEAEAVRDKQGLLAMSKAIAYERDTICYMTVTTQIALHGCDVLCSKMGPTFESWKTRISKLDKAERMLQWRLHYGFPGPDSDFDTWRLPTDIRGETDEVVTKIGRCYALSILLDPERFGPAGLNDKGLHERLRAAVSAMHDKAPAPKDKSLGLFRVGNAAFYLTPFFDVISATEIKKSDNGDAVQGADPAVGRSYAKGGAGSRTSRAEAGFIFLGLEAPVALGKNIEAVKAEIQRDTIRLDIVKKWVEWFEDNRAHFFTNKDLEKALIDARASALDVQRRQAPGTEAHRIWSAIAEDLQTAWRDALL